MPVPETTSAEAIDSYAVGRIVAASKGPARKDVRLSVLALDPNTLVIRKGQLCDFYLYNDPGRDNIPDHVDGLFDKYPFPNIRDAVKAKYGVVPSGWE